MIPIPPKFKLIILLLVNIRKLLRDGVVKLNWVLLRFTGPEKVLGIIPDKDLFKHFYFNNLLAKTHSGFMPGGSFISQLQPNVYEIDF